MIDFQQELNASQLEAVQHIEGPLLVIAGAGSGKTRVIEYRVLYLLHHNIKASSILLLTFTRRAAAQMLSRASRHDARCSYVEGGTFHSFAYRILKKYAHRLGRGAFTIWMSRMPKMHTDIVWVSLALIQRQNVSAQGYASKNPGYVDKQRPFYR